MKPTEPKDQENIEQRQYIDQRLRELDFFPGTLAEYNAFKRAEHEIMHTGDREIYVGVGISYERDIPKIRRVLKDGCVGLIHYIPDGRYGIPVRRK